MEKEDFKNIIVFTFDVQAIAIKRLYMLPCNWHLLTYKCSLKQF